MAGLKTSKLTKYSCRPNALPCIELGKIKILNVDKKCCLPVCGEEVPRGLRVEEPCGDKVEGDPDDVEDCEAVDVEDGGGQGGDEQAQGQQEVAEGGAKHI